MIQTCETCGARCCRYFCFEIDRPSSFEEFENVRWYLMHEGVTVHIDMDGDWYIAIANRCVNLDADNRCRDYDRRPLICRQYDIDGCDFTQGQYEYMARFTKPEQIEQYARSKLGRGRFEKIQAAGRARVEKKRAAATATRKAKAQAPPARAGRRVVSGRKRPFYMAGRRRSRGAGARGKKCLTRLFAY